MSADDELRTLLRSAELLRAANSSQNAREYPISSPRASETFKPTISSPRAAGSSAAFLASHNNSLSFDLSGIPMPSASKKPRLHEATDMQHDPNLKENTQQNMTSLGTFDPSASRPSKTIKSYLPSGECRDTLDYMVIKFGTEICCRGSVGSYLRAVPIQVEANASSNLNTTTTQANVSMNMSTMTMATQRPTQSGPITVYTLGVLGQGVGEAADCMCFINIDKSKDQECLRYGMTVAIRSPASKDRLLGIKDGKPGFYRNLVGQGEKWIVLKGLPSGRGPEDVDSRGKYVRVGDLVLLQAAASEQLLIMHEGVKGSEAKFIHRDSAGVLGNELWQIELFRSQSNPLWLNRPYLSNQFLLLPPQARSSSSDVESRTFPGQSSSAKPSPPIPPLNTLSFDDQQAVLLRELLLVLSGVEGQYIRIKASTSPQTATSTGATPLSIAETSKLLQNISYTIDIDSTNRSIASQVSHLFPICESAVHIREFLRLHSRYDFGLVSHAAVAAMKSIMREFDVVIAQLEHLLLTNKLTLQKMVYLLHPSKATLCGVLSPLIRRLSDSSGGKLLDVLHTALLEQGDSKARAILLHILNEAANPFLEMLSSWLFRGDLNDPYKEFMIKEDTSVSRDALQEDFNAQYWEHRYTLREAAVPKLLRDQAHKALVAGKYLNVVRECLEELLNSTKASGPSTALSATPILINSNALIPLHTKESSPSWIQEMNLPEPRTLRLDLQSNSTTSSLVEAIHNTYTFSSKALLQLLQHAYHISEHLRSLRRFFLLENGDFFIQFMDTAEDELRREVRDVALTRIQNLLQLAVQTSTLASDLHREDLSCSLAPHNLIQHLHLIQSAGDMLTMGSSTATAVSSATVNEGLKGFEALILEYRVGWPMSIVLSKRAITKYQLLSRLLYFSKHVERRVLLCWSDHQTTKSLDVRKALGKSYCLRHRMLHFLQNFVYYMTFEVINPRSHEMENAMSVANDLDEMLTCHEKFLDLCLKECLLASQDLLKILTKIMTTCLLFADNMKRSYAESYDDHGELVDDSIQDKKDVSSMTITKQLSSKKVDSKDGSKPSTIKANIVKNIRARSEFIHKETAHESFQKMLQKFETTFDAQLREFLDKLWTDSFRHHPQLSNLCIRLDYNGFYSGKFSNIDEMTGEGATLQRLNASIAGASIAGLSIHG